LNIFLKLIRIKHFCVSKIIPRIFYRDILSAYRFLLKICFCVKKSEKCSSEVKFVLVEIGHIW
jgi:hypothetical protein